MNILTQKQIDRFWGYVDKEKSTTFYNGTRCWEWTASISKKGYGVFRYGYSHRVSWTVSIGDIPENMWVLHHCDNRSCCNPHHLFLGTNADNMNDKTAKGRQSYGETHGMSKLTNKQVEEIRSRYGYYGANGENSTILSKEFGVSCSQICKIVKHRSRK